MRGKRTVLLAAVFLACLSGVMPASAQARRLNVVCSVQIEWCELVRKTYQQATGVRMAVIHRSSIEALALLMSERKIGSVIVNGEEGEFRGIFTLTDALNALVEISRTARRRA